MEPSDVLPLQRGTWVGFKCRRRKVPNAQIMPHQPQRAGASPLLLNPGGSFHLYQSPHSIGGRAQHYHCTQNAPYSRDESTHNVCMCGACLEHIVYFGRPRGTRESAAKGKSQSCHRTRLVFRIPYGPTPNKSPPTEPGTPSPLYRTPRRTLPSCDKTLEHVPVTKAPPFTITHKFPAMQAVNR